MYLAEPLLAKGIRIPRVRFFYPSVYVIVQGAVKLNNVIFLCVVPNDNPLGLHETFCSSDLEMPLVAVDGEARAAFAPDDGRPVEAIALETFAEEVESHFILTPILFKLKLVDIFLIP